MLWVLLAFAMAMMVSRRWHDDWGWGSHRGRGRRHEMDQRVSALEAELAARDDTVALLEARVNELESRLDFTERLLMTAKAERE